MHKRARPDRRSQAPPMPVCAQSVSPPVCTIHRTAPTRPWNRGASQMTRHAHGTWDKVRVRWTRQRRRLSIEHQTSRPDWLPRRIDKWAGEDCVDSLAYLAPVVKPFPRATAIPNLTILMGQQHRFAVRFANCSPPAIRRRMFSGKARLRLHIAVPYLELLRVQSHLSPVILSVSDAGTSSVGA